MNNGMEKKKLNATGYALKTVEKARTCFKMKYT